jgi:hypothetical protein
MTQSTDLLNHFLSAFATAIDKAGRLGTQAAWQGSTERTGFYNELFRSIAAQMDLELKREVLQVDYALVSRHTKVPRVFIESENQAWSAEQEVAKLCCLSAPVKMLVSVVEWDDQSGVWPRGAARTKLIARWREIVGQHSADGLISGRIAALIGEWRNDGHLHFYCEDLASNAPLPEPFVALDMRSAKPSEPVV